LKNYSLPYGPENRAAGINYFCPNTTQNEDYFEDCLIHKLANVEDDVRDVYATKPGKLTVENRFDDKSMHSI